jgi:hypothetical protein
MSTLHPALAQIDAFLAVTGWSDTYFGKRAVNNSELIPRLRAGGSMHHTTEARVLEFIKSSPSAERPSAEAS